MIKTYEVSKSFVSLESLKKLRKFDLSEFI